MFTEPPRDFLFFSAYLQTIHFDLQALPVECQSIGSEGECFAATAVRQLGQQQEGTGRTARGSPGCDTVEMLSCTSALPYMSKHFHRNESLFPGGGEKRRWPNGGKNDANTHTDAHMQRGLKGH